MNSRKEKFRYNRSSKRLKVLVFTLFLTFGIASSVNIAFANENIQLMLLKWFDQQKANSIEIIESVILSEKEKQVALLKQELQNEIKIAEQQLAAFTETEKEARISAIQAHANELIQNITIETTEEQNEISTQLNQILAEAINQMNDVSTSLAPKLPVEVDAVEDNLP